MSLTGAVSVTRAVMRLTRAVSTEPEVATEATGGAARIHTPLRAVCLCTGRPWRTAHAATGDTVGA